MTLQRLIITFTPGGGVEIRTLYRSQDGPNPGTKARRSEVSDLARVGLTQALEALQGGAEVVSTSGFTTREDTISAGAAGPTERRKGGTS